MSREFDLVLLGATGFVGRLTATHVARHAPAELKVALAGRDRDRLQAARADLPETAADWPLLVVDSTDEDAVADLAARTRVVCTTVGPYARLGMPLVRACAKAGTHYCDLTGEVFFAHDSAETLHDDAARTGARIVHSCGFDSVPSDLGVYLTASAAADAGDGTLTDTVLTVRSLRGGVSGGTVDSMRQQAIDSADPERRRLAADPYALSPDRRGEPDGPAEPVTPDAPSGRLGDLGRRLPVRRDAHGRWTAPFVMASYNTRVVRRSNALTGWSYGRDFRYTEVQETGAGPLGAVKGAGVAAALGGLFAGMSFAPTRTLLDKALPAPGEGPDEEAMASGRFDLDVRAATTSGSTWVTRVAAPYDPGYSGTAIMLGQSALALAGDPAALPDAAGVLTPATAFGAHLADRLRHFGFTFATRRA